MSEAQTESCGKCGAEIDSSRRADFTLKDESRACGFKQSERRKECRCLIMVYAVAEK